MTRHSVLQSKIHGVVRHGTQLACATVALACLGVGLCPSVGTAQTVESLNTLLFSPQEREAMEQARLQSPTATSGTVGAVSKPNTIRLDGVVARERGKGTAWVNGEPVPQGTSTSTIIVGTEAVVGGHRLKVGESFDKGTGAKSGIVAPDTLRHRPSP